MAQGNVVKKDKVNIPDWIITQAYKENDWVAHTGRIYRANGTNPVNTPWATGAGTLAWTEMSPSEATTAPVYVKGSWRLLSRQTLDDSNLAYLIEFDGAMVSQNTSFDSATHTFGIDDAVDKDTLIDVQYNLLVNTATATASLTQLHTALVYTDDNGASVNILNQSATILDTSPEFTGYTVVMTAIPHIAGRKYQVWAWFNGRDFRFEGSSADSSWTFGTQAAQSVPKSWTTVSIGATV